jgi:hypothetical protein
MIDIWYEHLKIKFKLSHLKNHIYHWIKVFWIIFFSLCLLIYTMFSNVGFNSFLMFRGSFCFYNWWHAPKPVVRFKDESKVENNKKVRSSGHVPWLLAFKRGRGACWSLGMGLGRVINNLFIHSVLHPTNHKLVSTMLQHLWC